MEALLCDVRRYVGNLRAEPGVRAACVLGSAARGDLDAFSDIDALVVIDDAATDWARRIRLGVPRRVGRHRLQLRIMTRLRLVELRERRTVYAAHVAVEGHVVFDRRWDLRRLRRAFPPGSTVAETGDGLRRRMSLYDDLDWCHGHYLACLADLYAFGRAGVILHLARSGIFDFGRTRPFAQYRALTPRHATEVDALRELEPFYLRVRRDAALPLPFAPTGAHEHARSARDACRTLLDALP
jgi:predicted nucleotidyltransferase